MTQTLVIIAIAELAAVVLLLARIANALEGRVTRVASALEARNRAMGVRT